MTTQQATFHALPIRARAIAGWFAAALVVGSVGALAGLPLFFALLGIALIVVYANAVTYFPSAVMIASVWVLALSPFSFGIETGVVPKLFADEMLLLLYLVVLLPIYWTTDRVWQKGFHKYFGVLGFFLVCQCASVAVGTDLIAFRNLLETFVLGPLLLVLFLQEAANTDRDELFADAVIWLTVVIAALSIVERAFQRNFILEKMQAEAGFQYFSSEIIALTEGVYRPYVTFFHPSEAGTFMAMGLPFVVRGWMRRKDWLSAALVLLAFAGLGVNATRGVWVAAGLSLLLLVRNPLKIIGTALPIVSLGGLAGYLALRSTPFMQRLTDLNNLLARFTYWKLGIDVFGDHKLLGVGHMQFQKVYLDYVHYLSDSAQFDITQIFVLDNIYLTTLTEHGLVGFIGLVVFFVCTGILLVRLRESLLRAGLVSQASLIRTAQLVLVVYAVSGFFADVNQFTKATKFFFIVIGFALGSGARSLRMAKGVEINDVFELEHAR
jgi:hypothetical protein